MTIILPEVDIFASIDLTPSCEYKECGSKVQMFFFAKYICANKTVDKFFCKDCYIFLSQRRGEWTCTGCGDVHGPCWHRDLFGQYEWTVLGM